MASPQQLNTELSRVFFADMVGLYPASERQYDCPGISDIHYCQLGVLRCLSSSVTGQEFLQYHADQNVADIEPGHFFKALKSARRLENIMSLNDLLATPMTRHVADPYAQCRELDDWEIYAVDGHYHKAACFDPKREASDGTVRATATGHFFRVNMRTHHLSCLAMAEPKDGKKEHDMAAIKRSTAEALRNGAPTGRKVMLIISGRGASQGAARLSNQRTSQNAIFFLASIGVVVIFPMLHGCQRSRGRWIASAATGSKMAPSRVHNPSNHRDARASEHESRITMKNHNLINPIGVTLKHVSLAVAVVAGLGVTPTHAAIGVGTTGSAVQTFDAAPSVASGWSTKTAWTGTPADVTDAAGLDAAVALLAATDVANALTSSGTYPPGTNALARFNSNRQGLQTNPTTVVKGCLLMATLQNTSGAAINQLEIAYDFARPSAGTEELAGLRCYYSMTGLAESWTVIPDLCTATPGTPSALVNLTATPWADATTLYVLWADDSSTAAGDSYIIDNVIFGRGADIKAFGLPGTLATVTGNRFANYVNTDITWYVPAATDVTTLAPTITLSGGASVVPATEVPQDFTNPVQYVVTAGDPLITKTYTVTAVVGPVPVPISNVTTPAEVNNPAAGVKIDLAVGTGTSAILVGTTQTHWQVGVSKNVIMNGNTFNNLFGSNQRTFSGAISGTGVLNIASTGAAPGITYSGGVGNTYEAPTTLSQVATLKKTSGDALRGTITMNNAASKMIWGASDQLNDATDLSLTVSGANLDISAKQDTINELRLVTGTFVQTGAGGILKVTKLFINGEQQPEVAYVAGDNFVLGTGHIEVGASGPPVILTPPAVPAIPNPADLATTAHPANLPKLDWADSSLATSYDVYFWLSTDPKPETPNANVALSEFPVSPQVLSLSTYKWQVVAKNLQGDTAGPEWTFSTVDRTLVAGNFSSGYSDFTHNLNYIVGVGNSAILQGNFRVHWSGGQGSFSVPVDTNGFILDADTGGGNGGHVASGPISGTGSFVITHGPAGGAWDNIYTISGATPNTYTGPTLLKRGTIRMAKTAGVDALPPGTVPITLGMAGDTARLVWGASNQINDAAAITVLLPTVTVAAADANLNFLNLAGFSDTIAALTLPDDGTKTQIRTGTGGVLTVTTLTVNGIVMGSGTYTEANSTFVKGTGSVVVPGAGTTYNSWKVAHAGGQTAGEDFDNDGVSNGVEYFMNAPDGFTANPGVVAGKVTWPHVNPVASFVVQVSDNLTNWVPADPADIDTTTDPTKVVYTLPTGAAKKFCRLFVTP